MDVAMGEVQGRGPVSRRLGEFGKVVDLCFGGYGEASQGVHKLVDIMANQRVRSLALTNGRAPPANQLGIETSLIRRRLSTAVVRANQTLLLTRLGQVGDGAGMASRRRQWVRREEARMRLLREAAWQVEVTGKELVRKGMFWKR